MARFGPDFRQRRRIFPIFRVDCRFPRKLAADWLAGRKANGQPFSSYRQEEARLRLYVLPALGHRDMETNDSLLPVLSRACLGAGDADESLILGRQGGTINHRTLRTIHLRVCKRAGVRAIRIHDLRHTFASHYIMNGGSLAELQGLLGHTSPTMTLKYAHLAPGFLESKAKVVSFSSVSTDTQEMPR
jgi:integrase